MLVRVLAMALCLCPSQVGVLSKRPNKSGWFLAWELLSTYTLHCIIRKLGYLQNKGTCLWNSAPNSRFRNFFARHDRSIEEMCYQVSSTKVHAKLTTSPSSDARPL